MIKIKSIIKNNIKNIFDRRINRRIIFNKKAVFAIFNRRGFTYILSASFILAVILLVFLTSNSYRNQDQQQLYQLRIRSMNDFVKNFNSDVHRATYISAFRSLVALEDSVTTRGVFLNNTADSFRETFFYGTLDGADVAIMENSSFSEYIDKVKILASNVGINLEVNVTKIVLSQSNPWFIDVDVIAYVNMSDSKRLSSWVYTQDFLTQIPISDLRDPLYGKFTLNKVPNTIRRLNSSNLVNGTNTYYLQSLINGSYYIASPYAPNFLERFEGNNSADINGIESIVFIRSLSDQGIDVLENSVKIDFIYFNNISTDKICNVQNVPANLFFVIPSNRVNYYNVSGLNYSVICP